MLAWIAVGGGIGLLARRVVDRLREAGHAARILIRGDVKALMVFGGAVDVTAGRPNVDDVRQGS